MHSSYFEIFVPGLRETLFVWGIVIMTVYCVDALLYSVKAHLMPPLISAPCFNRMILSGPVSPSSNDLTKDFPSVTPQFIRAKERRYKGVQLYASLPSLCEKLVARV